ncbi:MAG: UDP-N-acetylmuramate dehydrogenase [Candidatus Limnocylindrales bacterium]
MNAAPVRRLSSEEQVQLGREIQRRVGVRTSRDEMLAPFTTMRVGGPADLFAVARNLFELRGLVRFAQLRSVPLFLLGRGSDLVVSDRGMGGLVVRVRAEGIRVEGARIVAEAGVPMARLATVARDAGLSGAEFALAIPGTVGGGVWANAGAHGSDVRALLVEASVIPGDGGTEATCSADDLGLAYRDSRLKHPAGTVPDVVTWVTLALSPDAREAIDRRLDEIRRWRREHQPLGVPSAGSVFRNPPAGPSAGELIERAGLKGHRLGGASVSQKHANFIVNDGHGTAADVRRLAELIRRTVADRFGVVLQPEVVFAGDWSGWEEAVP